MKDQYNKLIIFLSLASIIFVLNNCQEASFSKNKLSNNNDQAVLNNVNSDSIFQSKDSSGQGTSKIAQNSSGIKKASNVVDINEFKEVMTFFLNLTNQSLNKEDFINFLVSKDLGVGGFKSPPIEGIEDEYTIMTSKPLGGIRHISGTFINYNPGDADVFRRVTFDLPKSETAFVDTVNVIENSFSDLGERHVSERENYYVFYKFNGYVLWIRQNFWEHLNDNPYNPYTQDHIGTITVTIEQDLHSYEEHDH